MANHYLEFSDTLAITCEEEKEWLTQQLQDVDAPGLRGDEDEYHREQIPRLFAEYLQESEHTVTIDSELDHFDFQYVWYDDHIWLFSDEGCNVEHVAYLVHKFLRRWQPKKCWGASFALTCSKRRAGELGGGAVFVTADTIEWSSTYDWLSDKEKQFKGGEAGDTRQAPLCDASTAGQDEARQPPSAGVEESEEAQDGDG